MIEATLKYIGKGGYSHEKLKDELEESNLDKVVSDIPYSNEVLSQNTHF